MKFSVLFLILILIISPCFCATQSYSKDSTAVLPVSWDLSGISEYYDVSFGFGNSQNPQDLVTMKSDQSSSSVQLTASASVDLWWNITAPTTVYLNLLSGSHLSAENTGDVIPWNAAWNESEITNGTGNAEMADSAGIAESGSNAEIGVVVHKGDITNASSSGTLQINLETEDASSVIPAEYSSTLTAVVRIQ